MGDPGVYGRFCPYFLAHSPRGVGGRHYGTPSDEIFFEALEWLREKLIVAHVCGPDGTVT